MWRLYSHQVTNRREVHGMSAIESYAEPARLPTGEAARFARLLKLRDADSFTDVKLARHVARGLPTTALAAVAAAAAGTAFGRLVPEATVRRAREARKPLSRAHSDRLYDVARVLDAVGRASHGDRGRIDAFLSRPTPLLAENGSTARGERGVQ